MRPLLVDCYALGGFADSLRSLATTVELSTAVVAALAVRPDVLGVVGPAAGTLVQARVALVARLRALARVVASCAQAYTAVEHRVLASFSASFTGSGAGAVGTAADADVLDLLGAGEPDEVEALLTASPALAVLVLRAGAAPRAGSDAARLADLSADGSLLAVHRFLQRLEPRRLALLALLHPRLVAEAPSAPVAARVRASRVLVAADLDAVLVQQAVATEPATLETLGRRIAQRREWLTGSVLLRDARGRAVRRRRQLLGFDPRGDGQVIELLGDADRAEHLAVFVPGTGSDLDRAEGTVRRMVPFVQADPRLVVVTWQGADFPDQPFDDGVLPLREHVLAAAYRDAADVAGPQLARDVAGLHLSLPVPAEDVSVLGHSYGGSVVGSAQLHGLDADRVVHVASAGAYLRMATEPAAGRPAVFSMTAYDDPIRLAQGHAVSDAAARWRAMSPAMLDPAAGAVARLASHLPGAPRAIGHGVDPDLLPGVVRLDTGRFDDSCRLVSGHSGMFEPGSTAWRNLLATMDGGRVEVLEPQRWSSHLEPGALAVRHDGVRLGVDVRVPHYVVDRSPWSDPAYRAPTLAIR
ncbi:alpha/beta hydrolase [Angustibacter luteus]|uniref:Alpha/beta hydrolase n=1 Tax=Angustibacter luteus TaxID=658456 RepID=A0ABW1JHQ2_9ACTN